MLRKIGILLVWNNSTGHTTQRTFRSVLSIAPEIREKQRSTARENACGKTLSTGKVFGQSWFANHIFCTAVPVAIMD